MSSGISHLPATASAEETSAALAADGAVIVDELVSPEVMDAVADELAPFVSATATGPDDFSGHNTRRTGGLIARSPTSHGLILAPLVLDTVAAVLAHATNHQLHLTQLISIGPGEPAQPLHRDQWAFDFFTFPAGYEVQCNTIWALTDFTEENGATRVIPGSHLADHSPEYGAELESVPAEMSAGSVLVWHGSLWHGGGANRTDGRRTGIAMNYCAGYIRQQENQQLGVPVERARRFEPRLRELCGYGIYMGLIGHIDKRDPADVVLGRADHPRDADMVWDAS